MYILFFFFFFKQKTAYEMRISDWSSDVCSSDLLFGTLSWLRTGGRLSRRRFGAAEAGGARGAAARTQDRLHEPNDLGGVQRPPADLGICLRPDGLRHPRRLHERLSGRPRRTPYIAGDRVRSADRPGGKKWGSTGRYRGGP